MNVCEKTLSKRYASLSNEDLEAMIQYEVVELTDDALSILKKEVEKRNLPESIKDQLKIRQTERLDPDISSDSENFTNLLKIISALPCPKCGKKSHIINVFEMRTVKSCIILTFSKKYLFIGCQQCITTEAKRALITTLTLGWWGFPSLIYQTPVAIYKNIKILFSKKPSNILRYLILRYEAYIKANEDNEEKLSELFFNHKFINAKEYDLVKLKDYYGIDKGSPNY